MYVLDTDTCVDLLRRPKDALAGVRALETTGPLLTTALTVQELHEGAHRARDPLRELRRVERLLSALEVLPHDRASAEVAGRLAASLLGQGAPIGDMDTAIAAITLHHGATIVTRNARHFRRVRDLKVHAL